MTPENQNDLPPTSNPALASAIGSPHLDAATLAELKPILDAGDVAISQRGQFQELTVKIAAALGVPCDNFQSEIIHAQYMELGKRILARIAENAALCEVADKARPN